MAVHAMRPTGGVARAPVTGRRSVREPSRFREHLIYLVVSVVALHVAGFLSLLPYPSSIRPGGADNGWRMQVRTVDATHAAESSETVGALSAQALSQSYLATQLAVLRQAEIAIDDEAAVRLMQIEQPVQFEDDAELLGALAVESMGVEPVEGGEGANQYWPRSALSLGPEPVAPVVLEFPAQAGMVGRYVTVLSVFIDEAGGVRRVRVDGPALPAELDAVARQAFSLARFVPGQINGRNVRSQIRVEVVFDSLPHDAGRSVKSGHGTM